MAKVPALSSNSTGASGIAIKDEWPDEGSQRRTPDVWKEEKRNSVGTNFENPRGLKNMFQKMQL